MGWIGVDLDQTLAVYESWEKHGESIGPPVPLMLERVKEWVRAGNRVKIFTARASRLDQKQLVEQWLEKHGLGGLEVTNVKDFEMIELWDDRAITVLPNQGVALRDVVFQAVKASVRD